MPFKSTQFPCFSSVHLSHKDVIQKSRRNFSAHDDAKNNSIPWKLWTPMQKLFEITRSSLFLQKIMFHVTSGRRLSRCGTPCISGPWAWRQPGLAKPGRGQILIAPCHQASWHGGLWISEKWMKIVNCWPQTGHPCLTSQRQLHGKADTARVK